MAKSGTTTSISLSEARKLKSETDWERLRALPVPEDSEAENDDEDEAFDWANAVVVQPEPKELVSIRLDRDVLEHFRAGGKGYQTRINAVLRAYVKARK